jgi:hypothetical protein
MTEIRKETDSLGEVNVPADKLWGAQTQRSLGHFSNRQGLNPQGDDHGVRHPLPYDKTAAEKPVTECAGCHIANVAKTDMTWIQFYPLLRDKKGY